MRKKEKEAVTSKDEMVLNNGIGGTHYKPADNVVVAILRYLAGRR